MRDVADKVAAYGFQAPQLGEILYDDDISAFFPFAKGGGDRSYHPMIQLQHGLFLRSGSLRLAPKFDQMMVAHHLGQRKTKGPIRCNVQHARRCRVHQLHSAILA